MLLPEVLILRNGHGKQVGTIPPHVQSKHVQYTEGHGLTQFTGRWGMGMVRNKYMQEHGRHC